MKSQEYREIIRRIVRSAVREVLPELKRGKEDLADIVAKNVHARMYGANVDGVDSPLWQIDGGAKGPTVDAAELLK